MSLYEVKVSRKQVLEIVEKNKQKHDVILKNAVDGFWVEAEKALKTTKQNELKRFKREYQQKVKEFKKQINKELDQVSKKTRDGGFVHMVNKFPEDRSDDYVSTISKLTLSVDDTLTLSTAEFEQFIRNKWAWRDSFLMTNASYMTGSCSNGLFGISGSYPSSSISCSWSAGIGTPNPNYKLDINTPQDVTYTSNNIDF